MARANQVPGASLPLRQHLHRRVYACASAWSEGVDYHVRTIAAFRSFRIAALSRLLGSECTVLSSARAVCVVLKLL